MKVYAGVSWWAFLWELAVTVTFFSFTVVGASANASSS